jgi:hypothetical protein
MSKQKNVYPAFAEPEKQFPKSAEGKLKKAFVHRYERRKVRECLKHHDELVDAI